MQFLMTNETNMEMTGTPWLSTVSDIDKEWRNKPHSRMTKELPMDGDESHDKAEMSKEVKESEWRVPDASSVAAAQTSRASELLQTSMTSRGCTIIEWAAQTRIENKNKI